MKPKHYTYLFLLFCLCSCVSQNEKTTEATETTETTETTNNVENGAKVNYQKFIDIYFDSQALEPVAQLNIYTEDMDIDSLGDNQVFCGHKISWKTKRNQFILKINNHELNFNDQVTKNFVWGPSRDTPHYVNHVSSIEMYVSKGRELLVFILDYIPCNGLGCGIQYLMVYDINSRAANFFGHFRSGTNTHLISNSEIDLAYVSTTFYGKNEMCRDTIVYELYTADNTGIFKPWNRKENSPFQIKLFTSMCDSIPESWDIHNWFEKINNTNTP